MLKLISKRNKKLIISEINSICALKDEEWQYGLYSQKKFFKQTSKKDDLCNFLYLNDNLIGFTILRKRLYKKNNTKGNFLLLDSMVLKKKYRKKNFKNLLMNFNNEIIKHEYKFGILFCNNKLSNFYKKYNWKKNNKNNFEVEGYSKIENIMCLDLEKNYKKIYLFVN